MANEEPDNYTAVTSASSTTSLTGDVTSPATSLKMRLSDHSNSNDSTDSSSSTSNEDSSCHSPLGKKQRMHDGVLLSVKPTLIPVEIPGGIINHDSNNSSIHNDCSEENSSEKSQEFYFDPFVPAVAETVSIEEASDDSSTSEDENIRGKSIVVISDEETRSHDVIDLSSDDGDCNIVDPPADILTQIRQIFPKRGRTGNPAKKQKNMKQAQTNDYPKIEIDKGKRPRNRKSTKDTKRRNKKCHEISIVDSSEPITSNENIEDVVSVIVPNSTTTTAGTTKDVRIVKFDKKNLSKDVVSIIVSSKHTKDSAQKTKTSGTKPSSDSRVGDSRCGLEESVIFDSQMLTLVVEDLSNSVDQCEEPVVVEQQIALKDNVESEANTSTDFPLKATDEPVNQPGSPELFQAYEQNNTSNSSDSAAETCSTETSESVISTVRATMLSLSNKTENFSQSTSKLTAGDQNAADQSVDSDATHPDHFIEEPTKTKTTTNKTDCNENKRTNSSHSKENKETIHEDVVSVDATMMKDVYQIHEDSTKVENTELTDSTIVNVALNFSTIEKQRSYVELSTSCVDKTDNSTAINNKRNSQKPLHLSPSEETSVQFQQNSKTPHNRTEPCEIDVAAQITGSTNSQQQRTLVTNDGNKSAPVIILSPDDVHNTRKLPCGKWEMDKSGGTPVVSEAVAPQIVLLSPDNSASQCSKNISDESTKTTATEKRQHQQCAKDPLSLRLKPSRKARKKQKRMTLQGMGSLLDVLSNDPTLTTATPKNQTKTIEGENIDCRQQDQPKSVATEESQPGVADHENIEKPEIALEQHNESDEQTNMSVDYESAMCELTSINEPKLIGTCRKEFLSSYENYLRGCWWSPDGEVLLTNSDDNITRLFRVPEKSEEMFSEADQHEMKPSLRMSEGESIYDTCWYPYMNSSDLNTCCFLTTSRDHPVHLWDSVTGRVRCSYLAFDQMDELSSAHSVSFSYDGAKIYCGFNKCIRIFDSARPGRQFVEKSTVPKKNRSRKHKHERSLNQPGIISAIAFSNQYCGLYALGSFQKTVGLYAANTDEPIFLLKEHKGGITQLKFTSDGFYLFSGGRKDSEIICWDMRNTSMPLFKAERHVTTNQRIQFDMDVTSTYMFSGSTNNVINIWNIRDIMADVGEEVVTHTPINSFQAHDDVINGISLQPSGKVLASTSGQRHFLIDDSSDTDDVTGDNATTAPQENVIYDNSLKLWLL